MSDLLQAQLHVLELQSPAPERLAEFYAGVLGMRCDRVDHGGIACTAPGRRLLLSRAERPGLGSAGYAFEDPDRLDALKRRIEAENVPLSSARSPFFRDGAFSVVDPDGTRLVFGVAGQARDDGDSAPARLQHFVMASPNCSKVAEFYEHVLGFRVSDRVHRDDGALTTCFLRSAHEHHSFAVFQAPAYRLDHHCYETTGWMDIRDWGDRLASARIPVVWGPGRHGPGNNLFLFTSDPDGNSVEFSAELEIVTNDRPAGRWPHEERTLNLWGKAPLRS